MKKSTKIYIMLIAITLIFLTTLISINNIRTKPYRKLENEIVEAMKKYYGQDTNLKKLPQNEQKVKITIEELKDFGLDINTKINNDSCAGYGIVTGLSISYKYKSYIRCNDYTTKNYEN